jgi:23S rRNA (cytosine1962-C5)-methyltransferase
MAKQPKPPLPSEARNSAPGVGPLRLRVRAVAESILRSGHPWLFAESVRDQNRAGVAGELAVIYDRNDRFLAVGLYDPDSPIRVRILHAGKPRPIDLGFFNERLEQAITKRTSLFDAQTTGFRWINGESDGWPGLVLDRYSNTLVLKLYTPAWLAWLDKIQAAIVDQLKPQSIVLRLSRNAQGGNTPALAKSDRTIIYGTVVDAPVRFSETGLWFEADVLRGQKTGFFLDQRENRREIETLSRGRAVLNAFSFSGGFSVYAARGGARSVTDLDISPHALVSAKRNFELNRADAINGYCEQELIQSDTFEWLAANPSRRFDLVILDPPSLAKRETERSGAIMAYGRLTTLGLAHLNAGGILLACSCSAHVSQDEFFDSVLTAATQSRRGFHELSRQTEPPDHPAAIPEARYLKAIYISLT